MKHNLPKMAEDALQELEPEGLLSCGCDPKDDDCDCWLWDPIKEEVEGA